MPKVKNIRTLANHAIKTYWRSVQRNETSWPEVASKLAPGNGEFFDMIRIAGRSKLFKEAVVHEPSARSRAKPIPGGKRRVIRNSDPFS